MHSIKYEVKKCVQYKFFMCGTPVNVGILKIKQKIVMG